MLIFEVAFFYKNSKEGLNSYVFILIQNNQQS